MDYIKYEELSNIQEIKSFLEDFKEYAKEKEDELGFYKAHYVFLKLDELMIQVKSTDNINVVKENIKLRKSMKPEKATDLLIKDIRASNRLIERIQNFIKLDIPEEEDAEYFKELRLISAQLTQQAEKPNYQYRVFYDLFADAGFEVVKYEDIEKDNFPDLVRFLIGQIMYSIKEYTMASKKLNIVFNELKKSIED